MSSKIAVITGGGSGIGRELAFQLSQNDIEVYIIGRRENKLLETAQQAKRAKIHTIVADIASVDGRDKVFQKIKSISINYLIHNAAIITPLKPLLNVALDEWREHFAINLEAPVFLTQKLVNNMLKEARILHISTGLAHTTMPGMGVYSASKSALHMVYQSYKQELLERYILVGSIRPGTVNTEMQDNIRDNKHKNSFPSYGVFDEMKKQRRLISSSHSAKEITKMLLNMSDKIFIEREYGVDQDNFD